VSEHEPDALARIAKELTSMRESLERLVTENARLRERLDASETARADLQAQTEHLLRVLADSRHLLRECEARLQSDN
jgi:hypothetical protein